MSSRQNSLGYSENLLDYLLNNDDLLDKLQDDSAMVATTGIIPLEFADKASDFWYLEGNVMAEDAEYIALVREMPKEIKF